MIIKHYSLQFAAFNSLIARPASRPGHDHIHVAHTLIATEKEAEGFSQRLRRLMVPRGNVLGGP